MQEFDFKKNYEMLNDEQKKVVGEMYGPIMVVAGPWTGKTQIIGMRTANIIQSGIADPENILITTFTEAGVIAIKKRLAQFIGTDAYKIKITTIHAFAQDVIMSFPEKFSEFKASDTIDDIDALQALSTILESAIAEDRLKYLFNAHDRQMYLRDIKDRIWKLKGEWISPEKFGRIIAEQREEYDQKLEALKTNKRIRDLKKRTLKDTESYKKHIWKLNELQQIYLEYSQYLKSQRLYDFSDMINFVVEKMRIDEELSMYYAEKFQFLMIDEYQDTNNPQNEIMDMILSVGEQKNIMVVGDDDQSIYRFQGANIENMLDFYTKYPTTQFIVLQKNYRSSQSILDLSSKLIENNSERLVNRLDFLDKKLIACSEYALLDENTYLIHPDELSEKSYVVESIKELQKQEKEKQNFAVIVRSNREVAEWTDFFQISWLEVESKLKTNILENAYVQFLLDFIQLVHDPHSDDIKLIDILRSQIIDVENIDIITLNRDLYKKNYSRDGFKLSFWEIFQNIDIDYAEQYREQEESFSFATRQETKFRDYKKLLSFRDLLIELNSEAKTWNMWLLISKMIDRIGLIAYIENYGNFSDLEDIYTFFNKVKDLQKKNPEVRISHVLEKFQMHQKYRIIIPRQVLKKSHADIEILTAHASKWLEYDHVFIPWLYGGNWESKRMIDKLKLPLWISWEWLQFAWMDEKDKKSAEKEVALQEDRRLFFVAITRAKKTLTFSRPAGAWNKPYIDSPFLIEIWVKPELWAKQLDESLLADNIKHVLVPNKLIHTSSEEIDYIQDFLENYKLSPTDLNSFLEDPFIFLQNVVYKYPFTGNEFTIFGNVYHKVLEEFSNKKINKTPIELDQMLERFQALLSSQLLTAEEKLRLTKKGIDGLTGYFENFQDTSEEVLEVEYNFRPKNIVFDWIPITGKIDKIKLITSCLSPSSKGEGMQGWGKGAQLWMSLQEYVALVDYKTGSIKTLWKIKWIDRYGNKKDDMREGKYYRQLLFYKLLAENDADFSTHYSVWELALDFVEGKDGQYAYTPVDYSPEDFEEFKVLIKDSWEKIQDINFWKELLGK